jgi:hypothetical protein
MVKPLSRWTWRHAFWLPLAIILGVIVRRNYRARMRGELPDEWHWADRWLIDHGFVVRLFLSGQNFE